VAVLEQIARNTDAGLGRIDHRLDRMDTRFDRIEARQADDLRFLVRLQITLTTLTIGLMLAGFGALGSLMAHGFKWWGG
jgi:hypothetical protein